MSADDLKVLESAGKFMKTRPRCSVKAFTIPEWAKRRRRPIFWPDLNKYIGRDVLLQGYIPLRHDIRRKVNDSAWSVQFDFASWYDQLPLHEKISTFFSVNGSTCLASLPMGFRPSAEVAHIITEAIADFPLPDGVNVVVYIDNIRFGGPNKEGVEKAAREFLQRADVVGAVLNERDTTPKRKEDFLGERFDLVKKTRRLTGKTIEKVKAAASALEAPMSFRQVAAIFGLLFFCSEVLQLSLARVFKALRYYREQMSRVTDWDDTAQRPSAEALLEIRAWITKANRNTAVPIFECDESFPELTIFCDASAQGWGAVCISSSGVHQAGAPWTADEVARHDVGHSTIAEPLAVRHAVHAFVSTRCSKVKIRSDHQGLVFAGNAGYGKSEAYNTMCVTLEESFPNTRFVFEFIPGALNTLADEISRRWEKTQPVPVSKSLKDG